MANLNKDRCLDNAMALTLRTPQQIAKPQIHKWTTVFKSILDIEFTRWSYCIYTSRFRKTQKKNRQSMEIYVNWSLTHSEKEKKRSCYKFGSCFFIAMSVSRLNHVFQLWWFMVNVTPDLTSSSFCLCVILIWLLKPQLLLIQTPFDFHEFNIVYYSAKSIMFSLESVWLFNEISDDVLTVFVHVQINSLNLFSQIK